LPGSAWSIDKGTFVSVFNAGTGQMIYHEVEPDYVTQLAITDGRLIIGEENGNRGPRRHRHLGRGLGHLRADRHQRRRVVLGWRAGAVLGRPTWRWLWWAEGRRAGSVRDKAFDFFMTEYMGRIRVAGSPWFEREQ
jgi:hypothetical protein